MPELRPERIGELFLHQDTRLHRGSPTICRSVDISDQLPDGARTVRLDYGYGGDRMLYVEIKVHERGTLNWSYPCFKVREIRTPFSAEFAALAERIGFKPKRLATLIRSQAGDLSEVRRTS